MHELFLRLANVTKVEWYQGAQFFAMVTEMMRRILVDAARARGAHKRGGAPKVNLDAPIFPQAKTEYESVAAHSSLRL